LINSYRAEKELDILLQENQVDLQFDFDKTLNEKAKKNKLTKMNVKNLIKVCIHFLFNHNNCKLYMYSFLSYNSLLCT